MLCSFLLFFRQQEKKNLEVELKEKNDELVRKSELEVGLQSALKEKKEELVRLRQFAMPSSQDGEPSTKRKRGVGASSKTSEEQNME
uniref:Uncharacterized protein n=1 Tax=Globodera rostochiensis TaxID=31243 RepID=A0A914I3S3_GLORO